MKILTKMESNNKEIKIEEKSVEGISESIETNQTPNSPEQVPVSPQPEPTQQQPAPQPPSPKQSSRGSDVTGQAQIIYKTPPGFIQKLLIKARAKIQERKQKKLDKIMRMISEKGRIESKDVKKALRVSHTTAFRYLNILEAQNKIKQIGKTGKAVFYIPRS